MKKRLLKFSLAFVLTAAFVYFFVRSAEWDLVWEYLAGVELVLLPVILAAAAVHFFTRAFRWKYLLVHEKRNVRFGNMVRANIVGFTVSAIIPGRLGELIKPLYLARKEGIRKGFTVGTVVVERIFDIFTMCFLLSAFLFFRPLFSETLALDPESYRLLSFWGIAAGSFAAFLLIIILLLYFFKDRALRLIGLVLKPLPERFGKAVHALSGEFIEGLKFFHSLGNLAIYALLSVVVWMGIVAFYWLLLFSFQLELPLFFLIPYVFLTMVGASIPTPGMVGGFHWFSKLGLTAFFGVDPNKAVSITLVGHAVQIGVTCLLGYAILAKEGLSLLELRQMGEREIS